MPLGMTVLQSGIAREEMTRRDAVLRKRKRPTAFVETAYADTRKTTTKRGLGKWEAAFTEDGWGQESTSFFTSTTGAILSSPLLLKATRSVFSKTQSPEAKLT